MKTYAVNFLPEAEEDIFAIRDYIAETLENPLAAERIVGQILEKCASLAVFPKGYEARFVARGLEIRLARCRKYVIAFSVNEAALEVGIQAVKYARVDFEKGLK